MFLDGQVDLAYDLDMKESYMRMEESGKYGPDIVHWRFVVPALRR